jgi:hypothetical protein
MQFNGYLALKKSIFYIIIFYVYVDSFHIDMDPCSMVVI